MNPVTFTVYGRPQQKGSKRRYGKQIVDTNRNAPLWQLTVREIARTRWVGPPIDGACTVSLEFYFARPRYHYGTGRNAELIKTAYLDAPMTCAPDIDKLVRTTLDGLTGITFVDDSRVARLFAGKGYGDPERVEVTVVPLA